MGNALSIAGYLVGNVDSLPSVAAALDAYNKDQNQSTEAAYDAAVANAYAASYALVPIEGAFFANRAVTADINKMLTNPTGVALSDVITLAGNFVTLLGQGVQIVSMASTPVAPPVGVVGFSLGEAIDLVGLGLSVAGVILDRNEIANYVTQSIESLGLAQNSDGSFIPSSNSNATYSLNSTDGNSTFNSTFTTNDGQGNIATYIYDSNGSLSSDSWQLPNGTSGSDTYNADGSSHSTVNNPDGSSNSTVYNQDGSSAVTANDGQSNITNSNYNAAGTLMGDSWQKSDGTHGTDTFNADGSSVGTSLNPDGTSSNYANDGQGNSTVKSYDSNGNLTGDSWQKSDGTLGNDTYNADGSSIEGEEVGVRLTRAAAEGAELASDETDVGEIDVAIDNIGDDVAGELGTAACSRQPAGRAGRRLRIGQGVDSSRA